MTVTYIHFGCINPAIKAAVLGGLFFHATSANAQSLGDVINSINILNSQVANQTTAIGALNVDVSALNVQNTTNTTAIAQLNYDFGVINAQVTANGTVATALDGRLATVEGMLPPIVARTGALELSATAQATATANNTAAIAANASVGTANTAAIAVNASAIAANATVGTANTAAIAANVLRDDAQDVSIDLNTSAIAVNANAVATIDARVDAHDVILAQHTADIGIATQIAAGAQTAATTLRGDVAAGRIGLVQQQTPADPITVGAQTGGTQVSFAGTAGNRRLSNVADGTAPSDAATVGQVAQAQAQAVTVANAYTDQSMANFVARYDDRTNSLIAANNSVLRRDMNAVAAATAAISSLPHSINPGEGMGSIGIGGRGDAVAFAIGLSKAFKTDRTPVVRAGAALDARSGTLTYNAAIGVHF